MEFGICVLEWVWVCVFVFVDSCVIQQQHSSGFGCWCHHRPLRSLLPRCRLYSDSLLTFLISVNPWAVGTPLHAPLLIAHTDGGGGPAAVHAAVCWPLLLLINFLMGYPESAMESANSEVIMRTPPSSPLPSAVYRPLCLCGLSWSLLPASSISFVPLSSPLLVDLSLSYIIGSRFASSLPVWRPYLRLSISVASTKTFPLHFLNSILSFESFALLHSIGNLFEVTTLVSI